MWKLVWANIKMTIRDKQAVFWSLIFPLMFIVIFGLFDFEKMGDAKYIIYDNADSEISRQFIDGFEKIDFLKKQEGGISLNEAKMELKDGNIDFIIIIPEDFKIIQLEFEQAPGDIPPTTEMADVELPKPGAIKVYYDESNITANQVAFSVVDKFIDQMNLGVANAPILFTYETESVQVKDIGYIDVIMPGILGMAIMMSAIIGIATGITRYRERKLLKRLSATPLKVRDFLMAEVLNYLVLNIVQITLIILLAKFAFDVHVYGNYLIIYAVCIFGSLIFLNIGFAIAGYSKNTKTAESLSQVIAMPMMFLSGVFFPAEALPKVIGSIVEFLPLTPMIEALRKVSIGGEGITDIWIQLAFMAGWIVISFLLAWRTFKFKD